MRETHAFSVRAANVVLRLSEKIGRWAGYSASAYEREITRLLSELFPFSILPGIRLFGSEPRGQIAFGFEMDNLMHVRLGAADYIVIIEAKNQPVIVEKGRWQVSYDGARKCAKEQIDNHIKTMWEYLRPVAQSVELRFVAVVVSSDPETKEEKADGFRNADLHLCSVRALPDLLTRKFNLDCVAGQPCPEVLRVSQSAFLDLFRMSLPVEQLGHPELASAIRYVDRCRRTLDEALFQRFDPKPGRWVINGSAGMGKSVLLAYAAAVLCSGHEVYRSLGELGVKKATSTFTAMGYDPDPKRGAIVIMAMSAKQLENIRGWFNLFVEQFRKGDTEGAVRFRSPEFRLCRPGMDISATGRNWAALLVDEAHDLPAFAARQIAALYSEGKLYLVVACDRHQKLRLAGSDAKIIEGLDFTNRSTRLRHIYRNPAPVYIASLALMFRWFAEEGPKVIPTLDQLREHFGFEASVGADMSLDVTMRSDAHPANSWCHTVATFPDAAAAYAALAKEKVGHREVLWVRFSEEDPDFDYEQLIQRFTYHNCRSHDAHKITDKYIKGQDYPIVVIEGFPGFMDRFEDRGDESSGNAEGRMWAFRRELYLCASRATTFLYFICNVAETSEIHRIRAELQRLIAATAMPERWNFGGTKSWRFQIKRTPQSRSVDVFFDAQGSAISPLEGSAGTDPVTSVPEREAAEAAAVAQMKKMFDQVIVEQRPMAEADAQAVNNMPPDPRSEPEREVLRFAGRLVSHTPRHASESPGAGQEPASSNPRPEPTGKPDRKVVDLISGQDEPPLEGSKLPATRLPFPNSSPPPATLTSRPADKKVASIQSSTVGPVASRRGAVLQIPDRATPRQLAEVLGVKPFQVIGDLLELGVFVDINQRLNNEHIARLCRKRGFQVQLSTA